MRTLRAELMAMLHEQKELMQRTNAAALERPPLEVKRQQREVFVRHADRLRELIEEHGWPSAAEVGDDAARGAWLVAQHADTQLDVQRLAARLLSEAVAAEKADRTQLAFLEDRIAMNEGRYQVYGTQIADVLDGKPVMWPCADPERLDERRASVGLLPLAEHLARHRP